MSDEGAERRLTTILAADVVGYSRLMAADETGTLGALKALRRELIEPKVAEHRGRVVKLMGDGVLIEFGSVVSAVRFAVDVQRVIAEQNAEVPEDRRLVYRIGINIGDIIVEGSDIYGDGVNVAARLEALADPGGICVPGLVFDTIDGKVDLPFEDMSEQSTAGWHNVAKTSEIDEDEPKAVRIGDLFIALYKIGDRFYATDDICTHEFAMLSEGYVDGDVIECPLHQARFHIPSGKVVGPPADRDLRTFAVKVVGEDVFVEILEK